MFDFGVMGSIGILMFFIGFDVLSMMLVFI